MVGLIKTSERRQSIRSVRGGVEHGSRIIKAGIYSLYHSGSRIIGSRYSVVDTLWFNAMPESNRYKNVQAFNVVTLWIVAIVLIIKLVTM